MVAPTLKLIPLLIVLPEAIVRFLNELKIEAGRVVLSLITTVPDPVPGVQVPPPAPTMISPVLRVPPLAMLRVPAAGVEPVPPRVILFAVRVEPSWNVMLPVRPVLPEAPTNTEPLTVKTGFPVVANASAPVEEFVALLPNLSAPQTAEVELTVAVNPLSTTTILDSVGVQLQVEPFEDVDQVLVEVQLPFARA